MASSLHQHVGEVRGEVRWLAPTTVSSANKFMPGKYILSKLGDYFYIQGIYDHGKKSKKYKLDLKQMMEAKMTARGGRFTFYIPADKGTRFNIQNAVENEVENFQLLLDDIKRVVVTQAAAKNKDFFGYIAPVTRVTSIIAQTEGTNKPSIAAAVKRHALSNALHKTPEKKISLPEVKQVKVVPRHILQQGNQQGRFIPQGNQQQRLTLQQANQQLRLAQQGNQQMPDKTATSAPRILSSPNNHQKDVMKPVLEKQDSQNWIRAQDDRGKENIQMFVKTPEKKQSPEKHSGVWSTFGTPRNKKPLQENETSPQLSQRNHVKTFYGNNNKSIRVKRSSAKKPGRKSLLDIPSLSSPSAKISSFSTTPNVKHSSFSTPSAFGGEITSQGFSNLGNTCYMNAILQSILGLVPFVQELNNTDLLNTVDRPSLYNRMYQLYRCKYEDGSSLTKKNALRKLKRSLSSSETNRRFSGHEQNDAHEFMNICLDQMKEEVQKALSEDIAAKVCPVVRNFEGSLRTYIRCKGCKDLAIKDQLFNNLSLNIPHSLSPKELSLTKLLGRFFQEEELERSCDICGSTAAVQYSQIRSLPRVIILHLLRSEYHHGTHEKNLNRIHVDRFLEIGGFCTSDISGPPPFIPKKISPLKSHFVENETPSTDEDFVVTKPRRRLDMSVAADSPSEKKSKTYASASRNSKNLPDWVYTQTRPKLSSWTIESSDDDDVKQAKLDSLREQQMDSSEDEQVKRAKIASLRTQHANSIESEEIRQARLVSSQKQFDNSEDEQIERAKIASLMERRTHYTEDDKLKQTEISRLDTTKQKDLQSVTLLSDKENLTDEELMKIVENIEQSSSDLDNSPGANVDGNTMCNNVKADQCVNSNDTNSRDKTNGCSQEPSKESRDASVLGRTQNNASEDSKLNSRSLKDDEKIVETPSKRRKIEKSQTDEEEDVAIVVPDEEDQELKRALEMSKKEHDQVALEQSQMEEAIKLSLQAMKDMEVEQATEQQEKTEGKRMQIGDVSYRLVSVVSHVGLSAAGGHYISDVYDVESDQWTRYDDITAEKIKEYAVRYDKNSDGYIYFYMHRGCIDLLKPKAKQS